MSRLRIRRMTGTLLLAVPLVGAELAQTFDIAIVNAGKPAAAVDVLMFANQGKTALGTSGSDGVLTVDMHLVNLGKGTPVDVYEIECDGEIVIVIVAPGEREAYEEECRRRQEENPDCECRRIGGFLWGGDVTIDIAANSVTPSAARGGPDPSSPGGSFSLGAALDVRQMLELEDVASQASGSVDVSATTWAPGFQVFGDYQLLSMLAFGIEAAYSRMETETRLAVGALTGRLDFYELGAAAKLGAPRRGPVWPYVMAGMYHSWNRMEFEQDGLREDRNHETWRMGLGAGLQYWVASSWGLRFDALFNTTFDDEDADEHIRWKLGLMFRPFLEDRL